MSGLNVINCISCKQNKTASKSGVCQSCKKQAAAKK